MIALERVSKVYPGGTVAVESLDLVVESGTVTVLVGPSGCGKTTTLRMINRMIEPSSGRITIDGEDVTKRPAAQLRRGIGYVIQSAGLFPHWRVIDNVCAVPDLLGSDRKASRARALELLELVGIGPEMAQRYPAQLSGGQQQRVGVARALAADPPVLLMDEPFGAVDPLVRNQLQRDFLELQRQLRKTVVFVTHDIDEAIALANKVAVFGANGHLHQYATPTELLAHPADDFVDRFLGGDRQLRLLSLVNVDQIPVAPAIQVIEGDPVLPLGPDCWTVVVSAERKPLRWLAPGPSGRTIAVAPVGPGSNGRSLLDAVLSSPAAAAVRVDAAGALLGIVTMESFTDQLSRQRPA
ncbi:MAG: proline/glycine betaine transporter ATP-binding protein [Acidimicrobiia bacterium]|nr:proline/glycine betaine transporter ATP-binding protein [Acidimicrobiia bacterium]